MNALDILFFGLFTLACLGGALGVVVFRNPVRSAVSLIASLLGVAGLFLMQHAEFLFVVQIVLYVGGVTLLFLFLIMLVNLNAATGERHLIKGWPVALGLVGITAAVAGWILFPATQQAWKSSENTARTGNTEQVGDVLLRDHLLAFEVSSLLLLAALVAAVYLAQRRTS